MPIPQAIIDALNATQAAKDACVAATATKAQTATSVVSAQAADAAAATDLAAKIADLTRTRQQLEAIEDSYYSPDGMPPA